MLTATSPMIRFHRRQLTELWERLLQIAPVSLDDDFSEKGGDSLLAMEMLCELERLTGQTIHTSILFEARTIRQLAQMLFELDIRPKSVIKRNPGGGLAPIFLFHGDYIGGGLYAARLANFLGSDQPLFVVAPHDLGKESVSLPIEVIAADRLPLILNAQPKGPYRLCGYCLGGNVAFEVARLLIAAGEKVEMVGMIDSPIVSAHSSLQLLLSAMRCARPVSPSLVDRVMRRTWNTYRLSVDLIQSRVRLNWSRPWNVFRCRPHDRPSLVDSLLTYSPKPVAVPVIYFAAEYGSVAWRRISSDIETIKIEGNHAEGIRDPANLAKIAYHLRTRLQSRK
jgi:oxalate---CoA ligase